jgi:formylglycine-generating enzyme required for sulfatase activity
MEIVCEAIIYTMDAVFRPIARLLTLVLLIASCISAADGPPRIAVLSCKSQILSTFEQDVVTDAIAAYAARSAGNRVWAWDDIESLLSREALAQYAGCDRGECFAAIGQAIGARYVLGADMSLLGKTYVLSGKMVRISDIAVVARSYRSFTGAIGGLAPLIEPMVRDLLSSAEIARDSAKKTDSETFPAPRSKTMARIPGGVFTTWYPRGFKSDREYTVSISDFYLDSTEVTIGEYMECVAAGACSPPAWMESNDRVPYDYNGWRSRWLAKADPKVIIRRVLYMPDKNRYPVSGVDRFQAQAYCFWKGKRLPAHLEWNYACRGGQPDMTGAASMKERFSNATPLSIYPGAAHTANPYGLYDMLGNMREWAGDDRLIAELKNVDRLSDPVGHGSVKGPFEGNDNQLYGVVMGPDFMSPGERIHCWEMPLLGVHFDDRHVTNGFRCAR